MIQEEDQEEDHQQQGYHTDSPVRKNSSNGRQKEAFLRKERERQRMKQREKERQFALMNKRKEKERSKWLKRIEEEKHLLKKAQHLVSNQKKEYRTS